MSKNDVLYHYTCKEHLPKILESGYLKKTSSNLKPPKQDFLEELSAVNYKPVVWLTDSDLTDGHGLEGSAYDKTAIKITVIKKPHMKYWRVWSKQNRMNKEWAKVFTEGRRDSTWFISESIIPLSDIVRIEERINGTVYYENKDSAR